MQQHACHFPLITHVWEFYIFNSTLDLSNICSRTYSLSGSTIKTRQVGEWTKLITCRNRVFYLESSAHRPLPLARGHMLNLKEETNDWGGYFNQGGRLTWPQRHSLGSGISYKIKTKTNKQKATNIRNNRIFICKDRATDLFSGSQLIQH